MILSKQYKKAMDKIVLSDSLKEKIISDMVSADKKQKFKNSDTKIFYLRTFAGAAACFALLLGGFSVMKNYFPINPLQKPSTPQTEIYKPSENPTGKDENKPSDEKNTPSDVPKPSGRTDLTTPEENLPTQSDIKGNTEISAPADGPTGENPPFLQLPGGEGEQNPNGENEQNPNDEYDPPTLGGNPYEEISDIQTLEKKLGYAVNTPSYLPSGYKLDSISLIFGTRADITYSNSESEIVFRTEKSESDDISGVYETYERVENTDINGITAVLKGSGEKINIAVFKNGASAYSVYSPDGLVKDEIIKIIGSI